ncbi:MAG: methionine synthase [Bradymonadales bacterium]|nr:methionine synthase [Bradymonadales bacterium]
MNARENLELILNQRIALIDGAMGTMIQAAGLDEQAFRGDRFADHDRMLRGDYDLLSLTQPRLIEEIHWAFLEAGADIIETNTFNANAISQADYQLGDLVYEMNRASAELARRMARRMTQRIPDRPRFVAGSIGPTNQTLSISPDVDDPGFRAVSFDQVKQAYAEQVRGLVDGGVDLLCCETSFDTLNLKAALVAIQEVLEGRTDPPAVMMSATVMDASGRTLSGQTIEAFWISVSHVNALSVGLNCSLGAKQIAPHIQELARLAPIFTHCYPNAGLPNAFGQYDESPETMAAVLHQFARQGWVNLVGGCCGTTPAHIRAIGEAIRGLPPRRPPTPSPYTSLAGLEPLTIRPDSNFILVGERTNVTGSRTFARLIKNRDNEGALAVARAQVEGGANLIDVNLDAALLDSERAMESFLRHLASDPQIARLPIMIDSSHFPVIETGLKNIQGKAVVNSISLKEGEAPFLEQARRIQRYGAAVVVMAFDEEGQAVTADRKVEICRRAYRLLTEEVGYTPHDIIFDPNVLAVATGIEPHNRYALAFFQAVRQLRSLFPHCRIQGGISNVSFSFRGNDRVREAIHAAFLYHAIQAGLDMGIVNAGQLAVYEQIEPELLQRVEDVLLDRRPDATQRLVELADAMRGETAEGAAQRQESWRGEPVEVRLGHALVNGIADYVEQDVAEALQRFPQALDLIEGPLMKGMQVVGDLFQSGKMFLPQVVKSARVMKKAVACLQPVLARQRTDTGRSAGQATVLLATVKGDVHDIGKNIVGLVLACNNHRIVDLGVMVPCDRILAAAREEQADIIGLSGLITPSLEEMIQVAREMDRQGFQIPLLIGGATTSRRHTAVRIAPEYGGPTVHVLDASRAPGVVSDLQHPARRQAFLHQNREHHRLEREIHERRNARQLLSYPQALENRLRLDWASSPLARPQFVGIRHLVDIPVDRLIPYLDWRHFFIVWDLKGSYPAIMDHPTQGEAARDLFGAAQEMLGQMKSAKLPIARAAYGFFPVNSQDEDILVFTDDSRRTVRTRIHLLRQQRKQPGPEQANLSLADFIAPLESGRADYLGGFAVTAGIGLERLVARFRAEQDDYRAILAKVLADRLAEACAEWLHEQVRRQWGFGLAERLTVGEMLQERYRGIRPAIGYPSLPDHTEKRQLFDLLEVKQDIGITLTESFMMDPAASVCGYILGHPESRYFTLGPIGLDQVAGYAQRKGIHLKEAERWLATNLAYEPGTDR